MSRASAGRFQLATSPCRRAITQYSAISGVIRISMTIASAEAWPSPPPSHRLQTTIGKVTLSEVERITASVSSRNTSSAIHNHA